MKDPEKPLSSLPARDALPPGSGRGVSSGALAAVVCTVSGAIALTAGFADAISGMWGSGASSLWASGGDKAHLTVSWDENEYWDSSGTWDSYHRVDSTQSGYYVIPVPRIDLHFDAISRAAGWPPDKGEDWGEGGLVTYSISVRLPKDSGHANETAATYIVRTSSKDMFYVLVRTAGTARSLSAFRGMRTFTADAFGVVDLANEECGNR
jgi:hypothetical protein